MQLLFLYRELELHYSLEEAKYLELSNQFFWDRVYSAAVVSVQGTRIPLQPRGSQVPGGVQPVLLGQGFNAAVVLYTDLELRYSLVEN